MTRSFDSWDSLNERRNIAGDKSFIVINGNKLKHAFKVREGGKTFVFSMRGKGIPDIISGENITEKGFSEIQKTLNDKTDFVSAFGRLDDNFFKSNILVYKVKKDRKMSMSAQFDKVTRNTEQLEELGISDIDVISQDALEAVIQANSGIKADPVLVNKATDPGLTPEGEISDGDVIPEDEAKGNANTSKLEGISFKYTMRTNGNTYTFTFNEKGAISAVPEDTSYTSGSISFESPKIMWYTDAGIFEISPENKRDLLVNSEITNSKDKGFFTKMFTDIEFRKEYLKDESEEALSSGEFDNDSIKTVLYDRTDKLVFADYSTVGTVIPGSDQNAGIDLTDVATKAARNADRNASM